MEEKNDVEYGRGLQTDMLASQFILTFKVKLFLMHDLYMINNLSNIWDLNLQFIYWFDLIYKVATDNISQYQATETYGDLHVDIL